jgi:hypothetical protein
VGYFSFDFLVCPAGNQASYTSSPKMAVNVEAVGVEGKDSRWIYYGVKFAICIVNFKEYRKSMYHDDAHSFCGAAPFPLVTLTRTPGIGKSTFYILLPSLQEGTSFDRSYHGLIQQRAQVEKVSGIPELAAQEIVTVADLVNKMRTCSVLRGKYERIVREFLVQVPADIKEVGAPPIPDLSEHEFQVDVKQMRIPYYIARVSYLVLCFSQYPE